MTDQNRSSRRLPVLAGVFKFIDFDGMPGNASFSFPPGEVTFGGQKKINQLITVFTGLLPDACAGEVGVEYAEAPAFVRVVRLCKPLLSLYGE